MAQRYTDPRAIDRMARGLCPECGWQPAFHGGRGGPNCLLTDNGAADRIAQYRADKEAGQLPVPPPATQPRGGPMYDIKSRGAKASPEIRDCADIARRVRADIKEAQKAGELRGDIRVSVRSSRYSGGQSVDATIRGVDRETLFRPVTDSQEDAQYQAHGMETRPSEAAQKLAKQVAGYVKAYNTDRSEVQVDHFDVTYYSTVYYDVTGGLVWG